MEYDSSIVTQAGGAMLGAQMLAYPGWVIDMLGSQAHEVVQLIPPGLRNANERARDAQTASGLRQLNPYGNTVWLTAHEELAGSIGALAGCTTYKPEGASFWLPVVNDTAIYAYRQDSRIKGDLEHAAMEPKGIRDALVALPNHFAAEQALDFSELGADYVWATVGLCTPRVRPRRALLVPFIANVDSGVLAAGMGEGRLRRDGTVEWIHFAPLDLDLYRAAPRAIEYAETEPRFDTAALPVPNMSPRRQQIKAPDVANEKSKESLADVENGSNE